MKNWLKGDLVVVHNCMNYSYTDNQAKLLLAVLNDIMEDNVHKLQLGGFIWTSEKNQNQTQAQTLKTTPSPEK